MFQLRDDVHWCNCEGRALFLNAESDRYFGLPKDANAAFLRLADGALQPGDQASLTMLAARGLLVQSGVDTALRRPPYLDPPIRDIAPGPHSRARPVSVAQMLAAELAAAWSLRTRRFSRILERVARRPAGPSRSIADSSARAGEIASAADALALVTRSHDRCLVRALAVHALCRKSGCAARLVFGVTAHPFTAHCWIQLGGDVVVGGYEQARLYTPILVVE